MGRACWWPEHLASVYCPRRYEGRIGCASCEPATDRSLAVDVSEHYLVAATCAPCCYVGGQGALSAATLAVYDCYDGHGLACEEDLGEAEVSLLGSRQHVPGSTFVTCEMKAARSVLHDVFTG